MSHYFQQLFVSSGLAKPAAPAIPTPTANASGAPTLAEISEERIVPQPAPVRSNDATPLPDLRSPVPVSVNKNLETSRYSGSARPSNTPGVIEIFQSHGEANASAVNDASTSQATESAGKTPPNPQLQPLAELMPTERPSVKQPGPPSETASKEASQAVGEPPSHDELIEHVFRWVGENPKNAVPRALAGAIISDSSQNNSKRAEQTVPPPTTATAVSHTVPSEAPNIRPAAPTRTRPERKPDQNEVHESSVEISIGTLQIQVEAPSAQAAKPANRPSPPRNPTRRPSSAATPPAIDINRLRRGFYL